MPEARSAYEAALALIPDADIVERSRLLRSIGPTFEHEQRYGDAEAVYTVAESVLGDPPGDDPAWWQAWLDVRLRYCEFLYWAGRVEEMEPAIGELEEPVRLHGDGRQRADFHSRMAMMLEFRDMYRPDEIVIEHQRAALREMQALGSVAGSMHQQFALGFAEMWGGHLDDAERDMVASRALAERIGDTLTVARGDAYIAILHRFRHRRREALESGERAMEACASLGPQFRPYQGVGHAMRGSVALEAGDLDAARVHLDRALEAFDDYSRLRGSSYPMAWIARLPYLVVQLREGDLDEAVAQGRRLLEPDMQVLPPSIAEPLAAAVELASDGSDEAEIRRHLEAAVAAAEADGRI
jgi:tetratricopeptide (TPR) repeat protein